MKLAASILLLVGAVVLALLAWEEAPGEVSAEPPPNVLLIVADDLGWGDLRIFNPSSKVALPALESLISEGIVVRNAHSTSSVCAPSRYSILSGNSPWRGRHLNGQWNPYRGSQFLQGQESLADLMRRSGYRTGFFGKWHLGARWRDASGAVTTDPESIDWLRGFSQGPADHGFDESTTALCGWQESPYALFDHAGRLLGEPPAEWLQPPGRAWSSTSQSYAPLSPGYGAPSWDQETAADTALAAALRFLAAGSKRPFFILFSAFQAHWSWTATGESGLSARVDQLVEFDSDLATLMDSLEARGVSDETLVIVTADNGGDRLPEELAEGHDASGHLRGQKGQIYEGGHRVPLVARWPRRLPRGQVLGERHLMGLHDLFATLAAVAAGEVGELQAVDSFNQLCSWVDPGRSPVRASMIVQDNRGPNFAFYQDRWKLTLDEHHAVWELFDLAKDPSETTDLAPGRPDLALSLRQAFLTARGADRTRAARSSLDRRNCLARGPEL